MELLLYLPIVLLLLVAVACQVGYNEMHRK